MSTLEQPSAPARRPGALGDPAGRATGAAGLLLVAGMALAVGDVGGASVPLALAGAGTVAALFVLAGPAARVTRRHPTLFTAAAVSGVAVVLLVLTVLTLGTFVGSGLADLFYLLVVVAFQAVPVLVVVAAGGTGLVLVSDVIRARLGLTARSRTPWHRLTGRAEATASAGPSAWRAITGLLLVGGAVLGGLALAMVYVGSGLGAGAFVLLAVAAAGLAVLVSPVLVAGLARADRGNAETAREDERQRMAAHLHDSVLQTLALVQRQAHDPAAVGRLARRQEHALRAWMAGEAELGSETLGAALRDAVAEVEDDHGAHVELTILGDRPLDRQAEALAAAAREALRNAARHAPGAPVFVFAQVGPDGVEAFVRDEGGGFALEEVPTERRGVRDAIIGRMAAAGGRAWVESVPGEGTEVVLRIDAPRSRG